MAWLVGAALAAANVFVGVLAVMLVARGGMGWTSARWARTPLRTAGALSFAASFAVTAAGQWLVSSDGGKVHLLIAFAALGSAIAVTLFAIDGGGFPVGLSTALGLAWSLATLDLYVVGVHMAWPIVLAAFTGATFLAVAGLNIRTPLRLASPVGVAAAATGERCPDDRRPDQAATTTTGIRSEEEDW